MRGANNNTPMSVIHKTTAALQTAFDEAVNGESRDKGATMVEYALLLVLVLLVAFFTVKIFGDSLVALFDTTASTIDNAPNVNP